MKPLACILAATDLSASARHATARAFRVAAASGSELHIVHVAQLDTLDSLRALLGADFSRIRAALEADARERLSELADNPAIHRGVATHARIIVGNPLSVVLSEADGLDADLVVVGARGESFPLHLQTGATASRLLRKSSRHPVLLVKQQPHDDYRVILVAVDFSPASLIAIRMARRVAPGAKIMLLNAFELPYEGKLAIAGIADEVVHGYVVSEGERRRARAHKLAAAAGLAMRDYSVRILHGNPALEIVAMEQECDADLVVVGKHGASVTEELLLGSVTKHVLAESQGDVLVICDRRDAPDETV